MRTRKPQVPPLRSRGSAHSDSERVGINPEVTMSAVGAALNPDNPPSAFQGYLIAAIPGSSQEKRKPLTSGN